MFTPLFIASSPDLSSPSNPRMCVVGCGNSGELGSAGWSLGSLCVVSLVCCVVVLFLLLCLSSCFPQVLCLCGLAGGDVHALCW